MEQEAIESADVHDDTQTGTEGQPLSDVSTAQSQGTAAKQDTQGGEAQAGVFQRWFPGWAGWYGYGQTTPTSTITSPTSPTTTLGGATGAQSTLPLDQQLGQLSPHQKIPTMSVHLTVWTLLL